MASSQLAAGTNLIKKTKTMKKSITGMRASTAIRLLVVIIAVGTAVAGAVFFRPILQRERIKPVNVDSLIKANDSLITVINQLDNFSQKELKIYIENLEFTFPETIFKVTQIETGNFKSRKFRVLNNLFGLQYSDTDVMEFKSWRECIRWQRARECESGCDTMNQAQYVAWLKKYQYNAINLIK